MPFRITIVNVESIPGEVVHNDLPRESSISNSRSSFETPVYQQTVENLNLLSVINAINAKPRKQREARAKGAKE